MMKLVIVSALFASAFAALPAFRQFPTRPPPSPLPAYRPPPTYSPQPSGGQVIAILRLDSDIAPDGSSYQYAYETANGIAAQEAGSLVGSGPDAALGASGSFQFTSPEGVPVQISYVADENGFQPSGNVLPTPPPTQAIPAYILRSLEYNAAHPEQESGSLPVRRYK